MLQKSMTNINWNDDYLAIYTTSQLDALVIRDFHV